MMHVASLWRSCGDEAEDGRVDAMSQCDGLHQTPLLQLCHFHCTRPQWQFNLLVGPIYMTQGVVGSLSLLQTFIYIS
jgi:hypothetical protein